MARIRFCCGTLLWLATIAVQSDCSPASPNESIVQTPTQITLTASNLGASGSPGIVYLQSVYRDEIFTLTGPDAGNGNWIDYATTDPGSRVHLHHDTATHRFVLVDADGVEFSFNDYSSVYTTAQQGAFVGRSPPGGEANAVVDSYDSGGNLEKEDTADNSGVSKTN